MDHVGEPLSGSGDQLVDRSSEAAELGAERPQWTLVRRDTTCEDEASRLKDLATEVRDQGDLERDIGRQVGTLGLSQLYPSSVC